MRRFFRPDYAAVYAPIALSLAGTLLFAFGDRLWLIAFLNDRWSPAYLLLSPFIHAGAGHFLLNALALHYIGGQLLLPEIGARRFLFLFAAAALLGGVANNLISETPAIGASAAVMALLACSLYPYGDAPMKLLVIHDLLRLPPFPLRYLAAFVVLLDIAGIVFGWRFFAHWAHLAGFAAGIAFGAWIFRRPPPFWPRRRKGAKIISWR